MFLLRFCAVLLGLCASLHATIHDYSLGDSQGRELRLNLPDSLPRVRGLIIYVNGINQDAREQATNSELVVFAEQHGFGLLATSHWGGLNDGTDTDLALMKSCLAKLAASSGHAELTSVHWLCIGYSLGGIYSYGVGCYDPENTLGILVNKSANASPARPGAATLQVPGILIRGELDTAQRNADILDRFTGNRARGALWAYAEEQGVDHAEGDSLNLTRPFGEELIHLRMPSSADGSGPLRPLAEQDGWLADIPSGMSGVAKIYPRASYPGDPYAAAWLPNRRIAFIYRALASHNKATTTATLLPGSWPQEVGTHLSYEIGAPAKAWSKIEFYEGDTLVRTTTPSDDHPLRVLQTALAPGYLVFHALVTYTDNTQATTPPRRTLVRNLPARPVLLELSHPLTVALGSPARLAVSAVGNGALSYQWYKNGTPLAGQTSAALQWASVTDSDSGDYTVAVSDTLGRIVSESVRLIVAAPKPGRLVNVSIRSWSNTGGEPIIVGFVVKGGKTPLLMRGMGPSLAAFGITTPLKDPKIELHQEVNGTDSIVSRNGNWGETDPAALRAACLATGAFLPSDTASQDAMMLRASEGLATLYVFDPASTGVAIGEVYDAGDGTAGRLVNVSGRDLVASGDNILVAGFVLTGNTPHRVLIRGVGPKLADFSVPNPLSDPILKLYEIRDGKPVLVRSNNDWGNGDLPALKDAFAASGAFDLGVPWGKDSAILVTLPAGAYTAELGGMNGSTGQGLIEVYDLEP